MGTHGHLYATRDVDKYVVLPSRPKTEVPKEWGGISPLSQDEGIKIKELAQENLSVWLTDNASGAL